MMEAAAGAVIRVGTISVSPGFPLPRENLFLLRGKLSFSWPANSGHMARCHQKTVNVLKRRVNKNLFRVEEYKVIGPIQIQAFNDETCGCPVLFSKSTANRVSQSSSPELRSPGHHETHDVLCQVSGRAGPVWGPPVWSGYRGVYINNNKPGTSPTLVSHGQAWGYQVR